MSALRRWVAPAPILSPLRVRFLYLTMTLKLLRSTQAILIFENFGDNYFIRLCHAFSSP